MFVATAPIASRALRNPVCRARHGRRSSGWNEGFIDDGYLIFQSNEVKVPITLMEVREAVDCCSGIEDERMKRSCYLQFGVDGAMAEKYYTKMEKMERIYNVRYNVPEQVNNTNTEFEVKNDTVSIKKSFFQKWFPFGKKE